MYDIIGVLQTALMLGLIWGLLALGVFISYRILDFADLTAEGSFTTGAAITAVLIFAKVNPFIAIIIAFLCGAITGIITGLLNVKFKIPGLLSGIITMTALYSINLAIMGRANYGIDRNKTIYTGMIDFLEKLFSKVFGENIANDLQMTLLNPSMWGKTIIALIVVLIVALLMYWFFGTEIGMAIRATGMNPNMSRAQGVNTSRMIVVGLALSNGLIALSGALLSQQQCFADSNMGRGTIVIGLAAVIVGEAIFGKRTFKNWLISVILGSIFYYILTGVAVKIGIDPNNMKLLSAILIVVVLVFPLISKQIKKYNGLKKEGPSKC